jgi:excisionase family DNA binding protein
LRAVEGGRAYLLTVRAVAARLGVYMATIYRLTAQGALPHIRVSNAIRFAPEDVEAYLAARRSRFATGREPPRSSRRRL